MRTTIFVYGALMSPESRLNRSVAPTAVARAILRDFKLVFNAGPGFGNIEVCPGSAVHGVLLNVSEEECDILLASESLYRYKQVNVELYAGDDIEFEFESAAHTVSTHAYAATDALVFPHAIPSSRYINNIIDSACKAGLEASYVDELRGRDCQPEVSPTEWVSFESTSVFGEGEGGEGMKVWSEEDVRKEQDRGVIVYAICGFVVCFQIPPSSTSPISEQTYTELLTMYRNRDVNWTEFFARAVRHKSLGLIDRYPDDVTEAHLLFIAHHVINSWRMMCDVKLKDLGRFLQVVGRYEAVY